MRALAFDRFSVVWMTFIFFCFLTTFRYLLLFLTVLRVFLQDRRADLQSTFWLLADGKWDHLCFFFGEGRKFRWLCQAEISSSVILYQVGDLFNFLSQVIDWLEKPASEKILYFLQETLNLMMSFSFILVLILLGIIVASCGVVARMEIIEANAQYLESLILLFLIDVSYFRRLGVLFYLWAQLRNL